jgi:hypothetical protein
MSIRDERHPAPAANDCQGVQEVLAARLAGDSDSVLTEVMERHLDACPRCRAEQEETARLWSAMGELAAAVPTDDLRRRLERTLEAYREGMAGAPGDGGAARTEPARAAKAPLAFRQRLRRRPLRYALRAGYGLAAALGGLALGVVLARQSSDARGAETVTALHQEVRGLREVLALSLLQQGSASARLEGVSVGAGLAGVDRDVRTALLDTLANDPNPNVRLAAVDALAPRAADPDVQRRLVAVLEEDGSPLVQIAAADVLLTSDAVRARRLLAPLAESRSARPEVREYVRQRLGDST